MLCYATQDNHSVQYTEIIWRASHMMPATHQAGMMSGWLTDEAGEFEDAWLKNFEIPHRSLHVIPSLKDGRRKDFLASHIH